jgi:hypothetical protein
MSYLGTFPKTSIIGKQLQLKLITIINYQEDKPGWAERH